MSLCVHVSTLATEFESKKQVFRCSKGEIICKHGMKKADDRRGEEGSDYCKNKKQLESRTKKEELQRR